MAVKSDLPQIAVLRGMVEEKAGRRMKTHNDFLELADVLENEVHEHVSESTLERVWGYSTRHYDTISERTLNVLAMYTGKKNWDSFFNELKDAAGEESGLLSGFIVESDELAPGTPVRIGWQPNRICIIKYLGNNQWIAVECHNSTMKEGDMFTCHCMQLGRTAYMDDYRPAGEEGGSKGRTYAAGMKNGLTTLDIL